MKEYFLFGILALFIVATAGYLLWLCARAVYSLWTDWKLHQELDVLEAESAARRQARREEEASRLNNGCDHAFDQGLGNFPPGVCHKCGISRQKPSGPCDHVWRRGSGGVPNSYCEKCGKTYTAASTSSNR